MRRRLALWGRGEACSLQQKEDPGVPVPQPQEGPEGVDPRSHLSVTLGGETRPNRAHLFSAMCVWYVCPCMCVCGHAAVGVKDTKYRGEAQKKSE